MISDLLEYSVVNKVIFKVNPQINYNKPNCI